MKKLIFLLLALPTLLTAQEKPVVIPSTCYEGNPFTIRIPVKLPENMTVQYAWYRNDTLIEDTHKLLLPNEKVIAYTIPANKAYGNSVAFHFKYCLNDKCGDVWTRSPRYMISFLTINCSVITSAGAIEDACTGIADVGTIKDDCTGIAAAGTIEDTCTGITSVGNIF